MTIRQLQISIASDTDLSDALDVTQLAVAKIQIPQTFTSATITLRGSVDGVNYADVLDEDQAAYTLTVSAGGIYTLNPALTTGLSKLKIATASAEAADRIFYLGLIGTV